MSVSEIMRPPSRANAIIIGKPWEPVICREEMEVAPLLEPGRAFELSTTARFQDQAAQPV